MAAVLRKVQDLRAWVTTSVGEVACIEEYWRIEVTSLKERHRELKSFRSISETFNDFLHSSTV